MAKIDTEEIKKAFDNFEDENFLDAEEIVKSQVRGALMDHIKTKLNLKNDIEPVSEPTLEPETEDNE